MRRLAVLALAFAACAPNPPAPIQVMAIVPTVQGNYETRQVELTTVGNLTAMKGSIVSFVGGTRVTLSDNDPLLGVPGGLPGMSDATRYEVLVKDKGLDVRGNFIERAGVMWPADFHTWNMVSTYYNFEKAFLYYQGIYDGKDTKGIEDNRLLYWSEVRINSPEPLTDNALYLSFIKSFVVVPFKLEQRVPMAMNLGIVGHEFAHRVFNNKALKNEGIHPALTSWNGQPFNLLKSLDEGLADFHGFGVTCKDEAGCRPNFLAASLTNEATVNLRDVSNAKACLDANTRSAFLNFSPDQWVRSEEMYKVGNLIAVSLYQAGNKAGKLEVLQKALVNAYDDASSTEPGFAQILSANVQTPQEFTPERVVESIVSHVTDPELKKQVCNEFTARLQLNCPTFPCAFVPSCPATSARDATICPTLPAP